MNSRWTNLYDITQSTTITAITKNYTVYDIKLLAKQLKCIIFNRQQRETK